jgi:hypothetical protein
MKSFLSGRSRATTDSLQAPARSNPGFVAKATSLGGVYKDHAASTGGATTDVNLAAFCRRHHMLKHHSPWQVEQRAGSGQADKGGPSIEPFNTELENAADHQRTFYATIRLQAHHLADAQAQVIGKRAAEDDAGIG